jgi:hypothetical protein
VKDPDQRHRVMFLWRGERDNEVLNLLELDWNRDGFLLIDKLEPMQIWNEVHKRFDIVVYTNEMKPHFLVECKEMNVELNETTLKQALNYFSTIQSNFLVITNGNQTYAFEKKGNELIELSELK